MSPVATDVRETYEVLAKLAEGGMGAIYQVRHRHLDQLRVIKVMRPQLGDHDDFEARFLREARMEAQLQHPNIAQLHEFEVTATGAAYMVMEYIDGVSLKEALASTGPLSVPLGLEVGRQALDALGYLHDRGFVHRDVSPDNLMFSRAPTGRPVVKVIDLGIAKKVQEAEEHRITVTGAFLGKVHYASPEQFRGADIDRRTDVYSFAIALYELLTGVFPIPGSDTNSLIAGHLFQPPKPFEESDPHGRIPEDLRRIILQALAKDREERPSTREFDETLAGLQEERSFEQEEVDRILETGAQEPQPIPDTELQSLLGTTPTLPDTDPETAPTRALSRTEVATDSWPDQQTWATRVLGRPGKRWIRGAIIALALATAAGAGMVLAPWIGERTPRIEETTIPEGPTPAEIRAADASLAAGLDFGTYHALVIGNDDYESLPDLETAASDARAVAELLERDYGFRVETLLDATREELLGALQDLEGTVDPGDNVLVYYAGHGALFGENPYWQTVDADPESTTRWVASSEVNDSLRLLPARHVLVVADSCYSGQTGVEPAVPGARTGEEWARYVESQLDRRALLALSSAGETTPVADRGMAGDHSVFAGAFLEILRENERILDSTTLAARLTGPVRERSRSLGMEQIPVYAALRADEQGGGTFFFLPDSLKGGFV